jgi:hypothetical protein
MTKLAPAATEGDSKVNPRTNATTRICKTLPGWMRTGKSRTMKEYPPDFTGYGVRALLEVLYLQGFFIIFIKIRRNKLLQPFILGNFYANGVPNSAIHIFLDISSC